MSSDDYYNRLLAYIKKLPANTVVEIAKISDNPEKFIKTVKTIIDNRAIEVEFSNDYKFIKRLEDVNYDNYRYKRVRDTGN